MGNNCYIVWTVPSNTYLQIRKRKTGRGKSYRIVEDEVEVTTIGRTFLLQKQAWEYARDCQLKPRDVRMESRPY